MLAGPVFRLMPVTGNNTPRRRRPPRTNDSDNGDHKHDKKSGEHNTRNT